MDYNYNCIYFCLYGLNFNPIADILRRLDAEDFHWIYRRSQFSPFKYRRIITRKRISHLLNRLHYSYTLPCSKVWRSTRTSERRIKANLLVLSKACLRRFFLHTHFHSRSILHLATCTCLPHRTTSHSSFRLWTTWIRPCICNQCYTSNCKHDHRAVHIGARTKRRNRTIRRSPYTAGMMSSCGYRDLLELVGPILQHNSIRVDK